MWTIRPSIAFIKGIPVVLTCKDHNHGTTSFIIHPPRSPSFHNLPSKYSDQLAHCSIRTQTIKPMSKKYYSNAFQMHEQRGSFNGIDTCNISTYRKFDFHSTLLSQYESCSLMNRPDINSLLNQLVEEKAISKVTANGKREYASSRYNGFDFSKYYAGATYVPFHVSMSMQRDILSNSLITVTIDDR